ncbi:twin-arginine translocase subunit TatC [Acinetobacter larvae]|nr:twin-arginine translocase subunit TatC [Acinetobacter larvae]
MASKNTAAKDHGFVFYFSEIRRHLIHIVIFFAIIFIALAPFSKHLYNFLTIPLQAKLPLNSHMIATDITSTFVAPFKLIFFISFIALIPFIFYKIYYFLNTALYKNEKKALQIFFVVSVVLFYLGVLVGYIFVLPQVLNFFLGIAPDAVTPMTDINKYLMFCIKLFIVIGFIFQLPLMTVLAIYFNMIELDKLKQKRRFVIVACFFIAMFITPPDIFSMAVAGSFMYLLFELGLLLASLFTKRHNVN